MRAKEYIELNKSKIQYLGEVERVIADLYPIRNDFQATDDYHSRILTSDWRFRLFQDESKNYELNKLILSGPKPVFLYNCGEIDKSIAQQVRYELLKIVEGDKSFGYIYYLLGSEQNRRNPSADYDCVYDDEEIKQAIKNNMDDYPKYDLDDYITDGLNYDFYSKHKGETDDWIGVFNKAYYLFDEVRIRMRKPLKASDFLEKYEFENEEKRKIALSLVSEYLNERVNLEQKINAGIVANELSSFIRERMKKENRLENENNNIQIPTSEVTEQTITNDNEESTDKHGKVFSDRLVHPNKKDLMLILHELLDKESSGLNVAKVLEALQYKNYLVKRSYSVPEVIEMFDIRCSKEAINKQLNKGRFENKPLREELQQVINMFPE